jgi:Mn2+/Fe2+ NRAMP family transporter
LLPEHWRAARWDTAIGAVLTQLLTAAVLVAAATLDTRGSQVQLNTVGDISGALSNILGGQAGRLIFSIGVLGAAMVAAIVSSLAMAWGIGEVAGYRRSLEFRPFQAPWFYGVYALCVAGSAALVWSAPDLVWLSVGAQIVNAFLLPLVVAFLVALATRALPDAQRLRGGYLWLFVALSGVTCMIGLYGGLSSLLP